MPPGIDSSKCVLIIGATAGIGRALALAIRALPSKPTVIVAGRRQERLDELVHTANDELKGEGRIEGIQVDVSASKAELKAFVDGVVRKWPEVNSLLKKLDDSDLDWLKAFLSVTAWYCDILRWDTEFVRFHEARIYRYWTYVHCTNFEYRNSTDYADMIVGAERELNVNYLAVFSLITFFLPHLLKIGVSEKKCLTFPA